MTGNSATQGSDDLEALFDSIVEANFEESPPTVKDTATATAKHEVVGSVAASGKVINQIGQIARSLHDALREPSLSKEIEKAAPSISDAWDRLSYVATVTQETARQVLSATEIAQQQAKKIETEAQRLSGQWQLMFEKKLDVEQFKSLVTRTNVFLLEIPEQTHAIYAYFKEVRKSQEFQDLSGQVIKKVIEVAASLEKQLVLLLVENALDAVKADFNTALLNDPTASSTERTDGTSQDHVDDLLKSLGF